MSPRSVPARLTRRSVLRMAGLAATGLAVSACAPAAPAEAPRWHDGRLALACGNTTGVYYQFGGGYADLITRYVPGYVASAEPTAASVDNIERVASGDMELGLTLADTAADAVTGRGVFAGRPQSVLAIGRVYRNYTHLVVRTAARIRTFADLKGKAISTGTPNSGTDILAGRLLTVGGLDPDRDVNRLRLSLPETVSRMRAGTLDAMVFSGGLPTPGIADLIASGADSYALFPLADLNPLMVEEFGPVYDVGAIPQAAYQTPSDVDSIVVPNLVIATPDLPEDLAYACTEVLYAHQDELARAHPEGKNYDQASGPRTDPVPLHPGADRYFTAHS